MAVTGKDRRKHERFQAQVPIVILGSRAMLGGQTGLTRDISETGIFFRTACSLPLGLKFQFKVLMPIAMTGINNQRATCRARVARVEEYPQPAEVGIAAVIESLTWS